MYKGLSLKSSPALPNPPNPRHGHIYTLNPGVKRPFVTGNEDTPHPPTPSHAASYHALLSLLFPTQDHAEPYETPSPSLPPPSAHHMDVPLPPRLASVFCSNPPGLLPGLLPLLTTLPHLPPHTLDLLSSRSAKATLRASLPLLLAAGLPLHGYTYPTFGVSQALEELPAWLIPELLGRLDSYGVLDDFAAFMRRLGARGERAGWPEDLEGALEEAYVFHGELFRGGLFAATQWAIDEGEVKDQGGGDEGVEAFVGIMAKLPIELRIAVIEWKGRRVDAEDEGRVFPSYLVCDTVGQWMEAWDMGESDVRTTETGAVLEGSGDDGPLHEFHYLGWSPKWDEAIGIESPRIKPFVPDPEFAGVRYGGDVAPRVPDWAIVEWASRMPAKRSRGWEDMALMVVFGRGCDAALPQGASAFPRERLEVLAFLQQRLELEREAVPWAGFLARGMWPMLEEAIGRLFVWRVEADVVWDWTLMWHSLVGSEAVSELDDVLPPLAPVLASMGVFGMGKRVRQGLTMAPPVSVFPASRVRSEA